MRKEASVSFLAATMLLLEPTLAFASDDCRVSHVEGHEARLCLKNRGALQHWLFTLEVDKQPIFALVDDYAERVTLTHTLPVGPALEFELSKQGGSEVTISGGCVPVLDQGAEVGRVCNFQWGRVRIVEDARFQVD